MHYVDEAVTQWALAICDLGNPDTAMISSFYLSEGINLIYGRGGFNSGRTNKLDEDGLVLLGKRESFDLNKKLEIRTFLH